MVNRKGGKHRLVCIDKPSDTGIIISTLKIVHPNLGIVIVATVAEGVDGGDGAVGGIRGDGTYTPGIVGIASNHVTVVIRNSNDVALEVFQEVIGDIVIQNTADAVLVVVQGN